jgi:hypothetical protein
MVACTSPSLMPIRSSSWKGPAGVARGGIAAMAASIAVPQRRASSSSIRPGHQAVRASPAIDCTSPPKAAIVSISVV